MKSIAEMQTEVYIVNKEKGWAGPGAPEVSFPEAMMLLVTEISEAVEAYRSWGLKDMVRGKQDPKTVTGQPDLDVKGLDWSWVSEDDHGYTDDTKPEGVGSELADILIRLLDDCERFGIDLEAQYERKMAHNRTRTFRHGGKKI